MFNYDTKYNSKRTTTRVLGSRMEDGFCKTTRRDSRGSGGMLGKKGMPVASTTNQTTNQAVHIYPNPGNDYFYVSGMDAGEVLIYDLLGKQVAKAPFTAKQPIAVGHLQKGIYFIKLLDVNNQLLKTVHVQVN